MADLTPSDPSSSPEVSPGSSTPLRCFTGAAVAGSLGTALYFLTLSIVQAFAKRPPTGNTFSIRIAVAVRTLVMGMSTLATAIFAIVAVGLIALGIQLWIKQIRQPAP